MIGTSFSSSLKAQNPIGTWKTIDDETGEKRSLIEIYEKEGKLYGKVIKIFPFEGDDPNPVCDECDEDEKEAEADGAP